MAVKYALFENHLTREPDEYMAKVQTLATRSNEDIIDRMISRGSTVTKAEALAVLEEYSAALEALLLEGFSVNTPLFNALPSIKGVFLGKDDPFDAARHQVRIRLNAGVRLRQIETRIQLERVRARPPQPAPEAFEDVTSATRNTTVTPGGLASLHGRRLKYTHSDPKQGVFFIDDAGAAMRVAHIVRNKPGELNFLNPETLVAGAYTLEVRARLPRTSEARSGRLLAPLQVR